jgi:hypothetical protein
MNEKTSIEASNVDLRVRSTVAFAGDLSDVARLLRKEEVIGKRLRSVLDLNANLERAIKAHENEIGDERASITYQLTELLVPYFPSRKKWLTSSTSLPKKN